MLAVVQFTAALSLKIALKGENIFTATEARFLPNAPTQNRPPDYRLLHTPPEALA
jgi:hypothetical protein